MKSWFTGKEIRSRVEQSADYQNALGFARAFTPRRGIDYSWVLEQAVRGYDIGQARLDKLDSKADSLIGYLGAVEGLLGMTALYVATDKPALLPIAVPTLLFFLCAIAMSLVARIPAAFPVFPGPGRAFRCINRYATAPQGKFAAYVAATATILGLALKEKARLVRWSYVMLLLGIVWFVLSTIIVALRQVLLAALWVPLLAVGNLFSQ